MIVKPPKQEIKICAYVTGSANNNSAALPLYDVIRPCLLLHFTGGHHDCEATLKQEVKICWLCGI